LLLTFLVYAVTVVFVLQHNDLDVFRESWMHAVNAGFKVTLATSAAAFVFARLASRMIRDRAGRARIVSRTLMALAILAVVPSLLWWMAVSGDPSIRTVGPEAGVHRCALELDRMVPALDGPLHAREELTRLVAERGLAGIEPRLASDLIWRKNQIPKLQEALQASLDKMTNALSSAASIQPEITSSYTLFRDRLSESEIQARDLAELREMIRITRDRYERQW